ncbi:hypothetical protein TNCV_3574511 [Trichonephila clavipes]|nr:hypothetical protein TNCV_3574511 [Trichonephila clavipes]
MYRNPVTSQYILDFKKCPIEVDIRFERKFLTRKWNPAVYLQVDDHVPPGNCPDGVLPSPAELGYETNRCRIFLHFLMNGAVI